MAKKVELLSEAHEINLPDGYAYLNTFEKPCEICGTVGKTESAEWSKWKHVNAGRIRDAVAEGNMPTVPETEVCWRCKGKGFFLTESGEAMLDFLNRHQNNSKAAGTR